MIQEPSIPKPALKLPPETSAKRIVVRPEDVVQRDLRPWRRGTLTSLVLGYLWLSALVVIAGVIALVGLILWWGGAFA